MDVANSGDTIEVHPESYSEVNIHENVVISGIAGPERTTIRSLSGNAVTVGSNSTVTIRGFRISGGTNPGEGFGVTIPVPADGLYDSTVEQVEFALDKATLKVGRHTVYVRMKNVDGVWGVARPISNDLELAAPYNLTVEGTKTITAAEYFIGADLNADPGPDNGIQINLPADGLFNSGLEDLEIPIPI